MIFSALFFAANFQLAFASPSLPLGEFHLEFNSALESRWQDGAPFRAAESLTVEEAGKPVVLESFAEKFQELPGQKNRLVLKARNGLWEKTLTAWTEKKFPGAVLLRVDYKNIGKVPVKVLGWANLRHRLPATAAAGPWALHPSSLSERPNWLQPLKEGSLNENFLGMTSTDYGGGTPLAAVWVKAGGLAVGLAEKTPKLAYLPISFPAQQEPELAVVSKEEVMVAPGKSLRTLTSFLLPFHGDPYGALSAFSAFLNPGNLHSHQAPMKQLGPIWCAWGYGREFSLEQIRKTLPMVKRLGFEWVGIDDGWQEAIGDWVPNRKKFPKGDVDFKKLVEEIHHQGLKVQLWWAPLAVHKDSAYAKAHPGQLLRNADGKPRDITWWDAWYLCPAEKSVQNEMARLARHFVKDWKIDGLKLDGQHLNASAPCFQKSHHHRHPEDAFEKHSEVQRAIFQAAQAARREVLVEACPCGTSYSLFNLPYQNMTVASDPADSTQVRQKGKLLHAQAGESSVFFGDHVELTKGEGDFASTLGLGGIVGSNFSLAELNPPPPPPEDPVTILTPEREAHWEKWLKLAKAYPLWRGKYRGELYDIAFDLPEAHAVEYAGKMHYAFFADSFSGKLELRGLAPGKKVKVRDYENGNLLGEVTGPTASVPATFKGHLLLQAD